MGNLLLGHFHFIVTDENKTPGMLVICSTCYNDNMAAAFNGAAAPGTGETRRAQGSSICSRRTCTRTAHVTPPAIFSFFLC